MKMRVLTCFSMLFVSRLLAADPPPDVVDFFRVVTQALSDAHTENARLPNDAASFLANFDSNMAGYAQLRAEVEDLVSRGAVGNTMEFVADDGDDNKRTLDLDWTLEIENQRPRRGLLKCTIERNSKKKWRVTALSPVEFFRY